MDAVNLEEVRQKLKEALEERSRAGWAGQALACPPGRPKDMPERLRTARKAGVVCLLCHDHKRDWTLAFMQRTLDDTPHSGQWAFPGGAEEPEDAGDLMRTALRECKEEIGLALSNAEVVGMLSPLYIPPSHFYVQPFVAVLGGVPEVVLQREEVARLCWVPLRDLPSPGQPWPLQNVKVSKGTFHVPGWPMDEGVLWGATAMMTAELLMACAAAGFGCSFAPPKRDHS